MDFAVQANHEVKIIKSKKIDKDLEFSREF